jgi:hypothetical protein
MYSVFDNNLFKINNTHTVQTKDDGLAILATGRNGEGFVQRATTVAERNSNKNVLYSMAELTKKNYETNKKLNTICRIVHFKVKLSVKINDNLI